MTRLQARQYVSRIIAPSIRPHRLLLAFKTALAAAAAWVVGRLLPGVDEYSYYAPLGALIVMVPTLMGSLRLTVQTVLGLLLGIALAFAVIVSPLPGVLSVALAVGTGVLLGGLGGLGAGRDYVPIAALFVLVLGGSKAEDYSLAYLLQMGLGMLTGVLVNALVLPPLWLRESSDAVSRLRLQIATLLDHTAERLREGEELTPLFEQLRQLDADLREAEVVAADAAESRRLNPRARRHPYDIDEDFDDLLTLGRLSSQLRNLLERAQDAALEPGATTTTARVCDELASITRAWESRDGRHGADGARAAIAQLEDASAAASGMALDARQFLRLVERRMPRE